MMYYILIAKLICTVGTLINFILTISYFYWTTWQYFENIPCIDHIFFYCHEQHTLFIIYVFKNHTILGIVNPSSSTILLKIVLIPSITIF